MLGSTSKTGGERRPRGRLTLRVAALLAASLVPTLAHAADGAWNVGQIVKLNLTAVTGTPVQLPDGTTLQNVRIEYVRSLHEAHKRIGDVSKVNSELVLLIAPAPNARADFAKRTITFTTGMLALVGNDPNMIAAVLGHEFAHLSLRHAVQRALHVDAIVYGAVAVGTNVAARTGDKAAGLNAAKTTVGLMAASFSRKQESEADRVGVEYMSRAKYDPTGVLRLLDIFRRGTGDKDTGYLDSHPGFRDRLANAGSTVQNQQYDGAAIAMVEEKSWKSLRALTDQWIKTQPDSGGAWYYRGLALRGLRQRGSLYAFEKAVGNDANAIEARLELCVELYRAGRERDSLVCSEFIPRGEIHDQYEARTFGGPVFVGGNAAQPSITSQSLEMLKDVAAQKPKPEASPQTVTPIPQNVSASPNATTGTSPGAAPAGSPPPAPVLTPSQREAAGKMAQQINSIRAGLPVPLGTPTAPAPAASPAQTPAR